MGCWCMLVRGCGITCGVFVLGCGVRGFLFREDVRRVR